MDIIKLKEHLETAMEATNNFVEATSELPQPIVLSAVAMILEEVSRIRRLDVTEVVEELKWAVVEINKEHGKYEREEE